MTIIGIDPGKNGCICMMTDTKLLVRKMPDTPTDLYNLLELLIKGSKGECYCFLEKVQGLPKMGGGAMFSFGKGYGWLEMALLSLKLPTETVLAQKWQKEFQLGEVKGTQTSTVWKNKLKAKAQQLFPKQEIFLWSSDAILIAEYGRRTKK